MSVALVVVVRVKQYNFQPPKLHPATMLNVETVALLRDGIIYIAIKLVTIAKQSFVIIVIQTWHF